MKNIKQFKQAGGTSLGCDFSIRLLRIPLARLERLHD
jgi:hypothetical protein